MFIPALIFICQAWSHITQTNVLLLERLQLVEVPQANPMVANVNTEHLHLPRIRDTYCQSEMKYRKEEWYLYIHHVLINCLKKRSG